MTDYYYNTLEPLTLSKEGLAYIIGIEGMTPTPYLDSGGVWTIGIGITSYDGINVSKLPRDQEMTIPEMIEQFKTHIKRYELAVNKIIKQPMTQNEFDAFVSFHYNTGGLGKSTAAKIFNEKGSKKAVTAALQLWNKDNGKVIKGLVRRRKEEGEIFLNNVYAGGGKALLVKANKAGKQLYNTSKEINVLDYL